MSRSFIKTHADIRSLSPPPLSLPLSSSPPCCLKLKKNVPLFFFFFFLSSITFSRPVLFISPALPPSHPATCANQSHLPLFIFPSLNLFPSLALSLSVCLSITADVLKSPLFHVYQHISCNHLRVLLLPVLSFSCSGWCYVL